MGLFDIDYVILTKLQTPQHLRLPKRLAWLNGINSQTPWLYTTFMNQRYDNLYILQHSSQVVYMQAVLNDAFDSTLRRIYIMDGQDEDPIYIYTVPEVKPVALYTVTEAHPDTLYTNGETAVNGYDFIVMVPTVVTYDPVYMKALVEKFRLASRSNYIIKTF